MGEMGRGTMSTTMLMGRVDILTGTLGKARGGASGGYVSARKEIVEPSPRARARNLFSNTVAPAIRQAASLKLLILSRKTKSSGRLF